MAAIAATPDGEGYWVATSSGKVRTAGDAHLYPARSHGRIAGPVVAMAATPDGNGYWLATADGYVYAYGDARLEAGRGATPAGKLVAIVATPDGRGYWLASASGKVVAHGDARLDRRIGAGATGPVVAMAATPDGNGYWLAAANGHVEAFGDARVERGPQHVMLHSAVVAMAATPDGEGYWLATADGHVEACGDAERYAATPHGRVLGQVVAMTANQWAPLGRCAGAGMAARDRQELRVPAIHTSPTESRTIHRNVGRTSLPCPSRKSARTARLHSRSGRRVLRTGRLKRVRRGANDGESLLAASVKFRYLLGDRWMVSVGAKTSWSEACYLSARPLS